MKKTSLISLLLSATVATLSLPMMATAVSANTENLLGDVSITAANSQTVTEIAPRSEGNKYLHVYNRGLGADNTGGYGIGFVANGTMKKGVEYYVSFWARASVENDGEKKGTTELYIRMRQGSDEEKNNYPYWTPTENCGERGKEWQLAATDANGYTGASSWIRLTTEWKYCEFKIKLHNADDVNAKMAVFGYSNNSKYNHPFDIDDFKIWTTEDVGSEYLKEEFYDFNSSSCLGTEKTQTGCFGESQGVSICYIDSEEDYPSDIEYAADEPFTRISGDSTNNTSASFAANTTLEAGKYVLSGDVRLGYYQSDRVNGDVDLNKTNLAVSYNGTSLGSADITNEWTPVSFEFDFAGGTISEIVFAADCAKNIDFKNITLAKYDAASADQNTEDTTTQGTTTAPTTFDPVLIAVALTAASGAAFVFASKKH